MQQSSSSRKIFFGVGTGENEICTTFEDIIEPFELTFVFDIGKYMYLASAFRGFQQNQMWT